jgi:prolyl-tRNA synthetase
MRLSSYHIPIMRDVSSDVVVPSHKLLLKSGMIRQISQGLYSILPLGVRVLTKISRVINEELSRIGSQEVILPTIQSSDLWIKSGRYDAYGAEMLRIKDRHNKDYLYSPTCEESMTYMFGTDVKSHNQLPVSFFQINWKFRDEIRPRFGLLRCREFLMMDAYSFDISEEDAKKTYDKYFDAYLNIFKRMQLTAIPMKAETGAIGGDLSHEFLILTKYGESKVYFDKKINSLIENGNLTRDSLSGLYARTEDEHDENACKGVDLEESMAIEVGQNFYYGDKYTKSMDISITAKDGKQIHPLSGCYGIGVTRLMSAFIEANHDGDKIIWNHKINPFQVQIINLFSKNEANIKYAHELYANLMNNGYEVLYDDTDKNPGAKLKDAEIIGIPLRIIIGKGLENGEVEVINNVDENGKYIGKSVNISKENVMKFVSECTQKL